MEHKGSLNQSCALDAGWIQSAERARRDTVKLKRDIHFGDRIFLWTLRAIAAGSVVLLIFIGLYLLQASWPAVSHFGWGFLTSSRWDPVNNVYGALPVIYGTLVSSVLACAIATPLSLGIALFINELAPRRVGQVVGFLVEMLAAIPSVVYGLWGIFVLAPLIRTEVAPLLIEHFGWFPLFAGPAYGVGMLTAGIILAVMIIPTISSISREVFRTIQTSQREAALALGATRWEMMRLAVLKSSRAGIFAAVVLGLGRALGETMAVTMVIGNRDQIALSLFAPAQTMASKIANEYAEAVGGIHLASLTEVGLVLFGVTFIVNACARLFIWRVAGRGVK